MGAADHPEPNLQSQSALNTDQFYKVSPYSIRNLSAIPLRIVKENN